jgi:hypothetical protein
MTWDQAGLKWRTYRSPKPRVTHAPVGPKELIETGDLVTWLQAERARTGLDINKVDLNSHKCCGYLVCACKPESTTPSSKREFTHQEACAWLRQHPGKVLMDTKHPLAYKWDGTKLMYSSQNGNAAWGEYFGFMDRDYPGDSYVEHDASQQDFHGELDWHQAKAAMVAGHVVEAIGGMGTQWSWDGSKVLADGSFASKDFNRQEPFESHATRKYRVVTGEP